MDTSPREPTTKDLSDGISTSSPLTEALVLARFREKGLASLLVATLPKRELHSISEKLKLNPLPGKRLKSMTPADHALLLARNALEQDRVRRAVLEALDPNLPTPLFESTSEIDAATIELWLTFARELPLPLRVRLVLSLLPLKEMAPKLTESLDNGLLKVDEEPVAVKPNVPDEVAQHRATAAKAEQRAAKAEEQFRAASKGLEDRENGYRARIEELQSQLNEQQLKLGDKNREVEQLRTMQEELKHDLQVAFRRAARFKHQLDEVKSSTDRETELKEALVRERLRAEIEQSKVEILEYQLDLADQVDDVEGTSVHEDDPTPERVIGYMERHGRRPRILIVGGAGKQRTHRERDFVDLKERIGFDGEWRFAEYGSWHRELPRLRNDIRDRYDLVFVLHWNRTTFVQKMHDEARSLHGRVRTVPYRGFLSLERALVEELNRFVQERG